jgi:membrane protein DedA with SNARE-associated domain
VQEAGQLIGSLEHFVSAYGVVAVTVILTIEAMGGPVPGESLLIFAAVLAGRGELSLPGLLIAAWAGSVVGDNIGYWIGRSLGRAAVSRYGFWIGLTAARFDKVAGAFARYGAVTVAFARFVNILRQLNGIVAGILGMEWQRFLMFNALGAALWVGFWVLSAFYLSEHISVITQIGHRIGIVGAVAVAVALLIGVLVLWRRRHGGSWAFWR